MELAHEQLQQEIEKMQEDPDSNEDDKRNKKTQFLVKLKRLIPGANTAIGAVLAANGEILTDPNKMACALVEHWQQVFTKREVDLDILNKWNAVLPTAPKENPLSPLDFGSAVEVGKRGSKRENKQDVQTSGTEQKRQKQALRYQRKKQKGNVEEGSNKCC